MEIFEDLADVDSVFVAVGGGGLIGGIAAYLKSVKPGIKVKGLNEEGKWTFFLNVHRMIRESHATLLVGFSIAGGYRRPTAACKNSYHRLLSLQSGSSVWILPCGFFFRAQTPITPSAASGKKLLKPKLLHWMKKYESGVRIFSRNLPSCKIDCKIAMPQRRLYRKYETCKIAA